MKRVFLLFCVLFAFSGCVLDESSLEPDAGVSSTSSPVLYVLTYTSLKPLGQSLVVMRTPNPVSTSVPGAVSVLKLSAQTGELSTSYTYVFYKYSYSTYVLAPAVLGVDYNITLTQV